LTEKDFNSIKPIVYPHLDKFSHFKKFFHGKKTPLHWYMSPTQIAFNKSKGKLKKEFNITHMYQNIQKLKSAVGLLVEAWSHNHKDNI